MRIPAPNATTNWQPNYSEPAVTERAIEYAAERFAAQTHLESISLTVNDGLGYSETDLALATEVDGRVSIGDLFRTYVNSVVATVPSGKKVAFIAYSLTSHPPSQPLASNVIPFLMLEPRAELPRWQGKAQAFGLYLRL